VGHPDQVKLRNEARVLKRKAVSSMRAAMAAFNSPLDDGRVTAVLLHLQHTFEMLMKAALVQQRTPGVFDKARWWPALALRRTRRSPGGSCV